MYFIEAPPLTPIPGLVGVMILFIDCRQEIPVSKELLQIIAQV
jgi:hypothetical protein